MAYVGYDGPDTISKSMLDQLANMTAQYSNLDTQLKAADGDKESALKSWMDNSDNAQAVKLRQTVENALAKLRELAEKNVVTTELSDEDKTKLQVEMDSLKTQVKAGYDVLKNIIENLSPDPEGVKAALETIDNPVKSNRGRKPGSTGSGLPRVSVMVTITGGAFNDKETPNEFDSFSKVAQVLNVEVKDLQLAFAEAAGVEHKDISTVSKPVEFDFTPSHPNATTYHLRTTPKERQKPGPKGKSTDNSGEEEKEAA